MYKVNSNLKHSDYAQGRKGMMGKKIVTRLVLVRHGETSSNRELMAGDVKETNKKTNKAYSHELDSSLSEIGKKQSEEIGIYFEKINIDPDYVIMSKLSRAYGTALNTIEYLKKNGSKCKFILDENLVEINYKKEEIIKEPSGLNFSFESVGSDKLDDLYLTYKSVGSNDQNKINEPDKSSDSKNWKYNLETENEFTDRVFKVFKSLVKLGTVDNSVQIVCFTHSRFISVLLSSCMTKGDVPNYNSEINYHLANGSLTCIDVDEDGNFHVHVCNYTGHLTEPTGQHCPFVSTHFLDLNENQN